MVAKSVRRMPAKPDLARHHVEALHPRLRVVIERGIRGEFGAPLQAEILVDAESGDRDAGDIADGRAREQGRRQNRPRRHALGRQIPVAVILQPERDDRGISRRPQLAVDLRGYSRRFPPESSAPSLTLSSR